jgi:hypothetical protein
MLFTTTLSEDELELLKSHQTVTGAKDLGDVMRAALHAYTPAAKTEQPAHPIPEADPAQHG